MKMPSCIALLLLLAACVNQSQAMLQQGYPPDFVKGYEDGCATGNYTAGNDFYGFMRDPRRYGNDRNYTNGWNDGFEMCKARELANIERSKANALSDFARQRDGVTIRIEDGYHY